MNSEIAGATEQEPQGENKRRFPLQWSLQTLLLLTAVVAVWIGYFRYRLDIPRLEQEIDAMRQMASELIIEDPQLVAAVKLPELWMDEQRWDIHLPEGKYKIRLATREIGKEGLAPAIAEAPIDAGRHQIKLQKEEVDDGWRIVVLLDDQPLLQVAEKPDWNPGDGYEGSGVSTTSRQFSPNAAVELHRRRFVHQTKAGPYEAPEEPAEGLLLWIERVD